MALEPVEVIRLNALRLAERREIRSHLELRDPNRRKLIACRAGEWPYLTAAGKKELDRLEKLENPAGGE